MIHDIMWKSWWGINIFSGCCTYWSGGRKCLVFDIHLQAWWQEKSNHFLNRRTVFHCYIIIYARQLYQRNACIENCDFKANTDPLNTEVSFKWLCPICMLSCPPPSHWYSHEARHQWQNPYREAVSNKDADTKKNRRRDEGDWGKHSWKSKQNGKKNKNKCDEDTVCQVWLCSSLKMSVTDMQTHTHHLVPFKGHNSHLKHCRCVSGVLWVCGLRMRRFSLQTPQDCCSSALWHSLDSHLVSSVHYLNEWSVTFMSCFRVFKEAVAWVGGKQSALALRCNLQKAVK